MTHLRSSLFLMFMISMFCIWGSGCDSDSGTRPAETGPDLSGSWLGYGMTGPCGEDWSNVEFVLDQSGSDLAGYLETGPGVIRPVSGAVDGSTSAHLEIGDLPGTSECYLFSLVLDLGSSSPDRINGNASGRCCGTVSFEFHWEKD